LWGSHKEITDEWRRIKTIEEAELIAGRERARQSWQRRKNKIPVTETITGASDGNRTENDCFPVMEAITTGPVTESITTSISRRSTPLPPGLTTPVAEPPLKLVWTKPVVRELLGEDTTMRRTEISLSAL